jgi:flagellin-like hook-associated protein FlgL
MGARAVQLSELAEAVIPYAPPRKGAATTTDAGDPVESAGQTILALLNEAAKAADANTKHALDVAHKLSRQLQAAESRIADLEADLGRYRERAERAENWLNYISSEIKQRFFDKSDRVRAA